MPLTGTTRYQVASGTGSLTSASAVTTIYNPLTNKIYNVANGSNTLSSYVVPADPTSGSVTAAAITLPSAVPTDNRYVADASIFYSPY